MADTKISLLTELTTIADADLLAVVDDPAGSPVTKKITRENLLGSAPIKNDTISEKTSEAGVTVDGLLIKDGRIVGWDGWSLITATWTRIGNHAFTTTGNTTTTYRKGTKVRYKDGGAYEYGTVISSSYADPITTVTLATTTDYAMAEATITDTYISYINDPEGFPPFFNFTPVVSFAGGAGNVEPTFSSKAATFKTAGNLMYINIRWLNSSGGTAGAGSGILLLSSPGTNLMTTNGWHGLAYILNGSTTTSCFAQGAAESLLFASLSAGATQTGASFNDANIRRVYAFLTIAI